MKSARKRGGRGAEKECEKEEDEYKRGRRALDKNVTSVTRDRERKKRG